MKYIYSTILVCLLAIATSAQDVYNSSGRPVKTDANGNVKREKEKGFSTDRLIFGGWGVLGIGSGVTNIGVTPVIGYRVSDAFSAGISLGYQYLKVKYSESYRFINPATGEAEYYPFTSHIYSPSLWARYIIWNNIFAHVEYEHNIMSLNRYTPDESKAFGNYPPIVKVSETIQVPALLVGGGLRQPISPRTSFVAMLLYDVLQDKYSPYRGTIAVRLGINAGF
ncbi:MAG: hypothetical protein R2800_10170 [Flavipsychrobacter sp.]